MITKDKIRRRMKWSLKIWCSCSSYETNHRIIIHKDIEYICRKCGKTNKKES